ncbi:MAG: undecaprenyl-diphosphate phosphatase [Myxococcota bacterium]|nr:undecaprenyl-diphosphate phosphatase [Myxococcota bacterium]
MDMLSAVILGLVQAFTEFLPVSSSGHLVLAQELLGVHVGHGAAFEVAVHFGTLLSVIVVYRTDVIRLSRVALSALMRPHTVPARWGDADFRFVVAILVGCVPAGVVGLSFKNELESAFSSPQVVCVALMVTGVVLLATLRAPSGHQPVSLGRGVLIGLAQAVAIIPGISRSGSTISLAMFLRVDRAEAARFSFLLSLPVIFGATLLKASDLLSAELSTVPWSQLAVGAVVSFLAGLAALLLLLRIVNRGGFAHFGWYCLLIGLIGLII